MKANSSIQKRRMRTLISTLSLVAVAFLLLWSPGRGSQAQQDRQLARTGSQSGSNSGRVALVIGNGAYPTAPLKNPVNDAHDIAAALGALGFEVISRENANQNEMKRAVREFGEKIRGAAVGLFYYAGHGVQVNGENYLVPVDAKVESEQEVEYECVKAGFVLAQMDAARNTMNIVILDACRNNPFARSFRSESKGLAQMDAPSGTLIAYATAPGSIASDGAGRNGLYTQELLKQMQTSGLAIEDVFKRVRISVRAATQQKQTPWESSSLVGDFYFSSSTGAKSAPPPSTNVGNTASEPAGAKVNGTWAITTSINDQKSPGTLLLRLHGNEIFGALKMKPGVENLIGTVNGNTFHVSGTLNDGRRISLTIEGTVKGDSISGTLDLTSNKAQIIKGTFTGLRQPVSVINSQTGMELVYVPPGTFMMGSNNNDDEKPIHEVTIGEGFYIGKYEVTQGQWQAVLGTTIRQQRDKADVSGPIVGEGDDYPMYYVNWVEAMSFVQRMNASNDGYLYRLPTEAEWEYACRAGTTGDYSGDLNAMGWYGNNSGSVYIDADSIWKNDGNNVVPRLVKNGNRTHPVGEKQANGFGLYDMYGNVWEWCEDWYHKNYEGAPNDGSAWLIGGEQKYRLLRGGSWANGGTDSRSAHHSGAATPGFRNVTYGFRVVAVARAQ